MEYNSLNVDRMNFFKSFLASILGTVVAFIFIGILMMMSLAGIATAVSSEDAVPQETKENSVLELDLDIQMYDNVGATQELEEALGLGQEVEILDVVSAIRKAAADNVKGIDLKCQFPIMGWLGPNHTQGFRRI